MGQPLSCFGRTQSKHHSQRGEDLPTPQRLKEWRNQLGFQNNIKKIYFNYPPQTKHQAFKQISKDVNRTFPELSFFTSPDNQRLFEEVLQKFSIFFARTGYTQGVNFLTGYLLYVGYDPSEAFTMLCKICTHYDLMCIGLYEDEFPLNRVYCSVLWQVLRGKQPNLTAKLRQLNAPDQIWIFQWFMTFFMYSFPLQVIKDILDFIFRHKKMAAVNIAYGIITELSPIIMKMENNTEFLDMLTQLKRQDYCKKHIGSFIEHANSIGDKQMKFYIEEVKLTNNFYLSYFKQSENDRKLRSVGINNSLMVERKRFLEEPESLDFSRNQIDISIIDSLSSTMHKSFMNALNKSFSEESTKMWASDLIHLNDIEDKTPEDQHDKTGYRCFKKKMTPQQ